MIPAMRAWAAPITPWAPAWRSAGTVLLTATPHSGDEEAFFNLLGLLRSDFTQLKDLPPDQRSDLREALSRHFVQRRRPGDDEGFRRDRNR